MFGTGLQKKEYASTLDTKLQLPTWITIKMERSSLSHNPTRLKVANGITQVTRYSSARFRRKNAKISWLEFRNVTLYITCGLVPPTNN
mmetsp:Transcript_1142/g.2621  ORF Transcript_1142/g.2621 Transcript_1142/m.2621 type:complete len:88 (-) Transcript_1142:139-402(-)